MEEPYYAYSTNLRLKWDLDGDGTYDTISSTNKIIVHRYNSPGTYNVTLHVKDEAGYTSTISKSVTIINQPPYVPDNPIPEDGIINQALNVSLQWDGDGPDIGDTATYDVYFGTSSNPPLVSSGQSEPYYNLGTLSSSTTYYWKIISIDNYGDSSVSPLWYFVTSYVDDISPIVTIASPTSSGTHTTTSSSLNIGGTASDNVGVTNVTWSNDTGGSGTANGTTNWSVSGITLQNGANVVTVTAEDVENNTNADVLTVTYNSSDTTGPIVSSLTPSKTSITEGDNSITISATIDDSSTGNSDIAEAEYYIGNSNHISMSPTDGSIPDFL